MHFVRNLENMGPNRDREMYVRVYCDVMAHILMEDQLVDDQVEQVQLSLVNPSFLNPCTSQSEHTW